ncbi:hypothetical protein [Nostoc sp.]|uniref:hypothetical protein n=1 Tax=Nostoc sp. TaxID=1180 RepID=UPI002FF6240D
MVWKPDFNKAQLLPAVLLMESLNLLQFLTPDVQLRGTDSKMLEFKALAVVHRHVIKNYLNVSISEKLTPVAFAQKLLNSRRSVCRGIVRALLIGFEADFAAVGNMNI